MTRAASGRAAGRRSAARLAAVQALYGIELGRRSADAVAGDIAEGRQQARLSEDGVLESDPALSAAIVRGATAREAEIDGLIAEVLDKRRRLDRVEAVMRALLRAGAFELLACPDVPARVVVNEYVDIAHAYFEGREPALANAVLDRLGRRLRPGEMGRQADERPPTAE